MIHKLNNEYFMAVGVATRDAQYRTVGEKQTPVTSFSLACGKRPDTTTIFVECKAWRNLATYASVIRKGAAVCAIGKIEEREYNGKTYKDLVCDWMNVAGAPGPASTPPTFSEMMDADTDGELPF